MSVTLIRSQLAESITAKQAALASDALMSDVARAVDQCVAALDGGGKVLFAGNGGSAADAQHLAGELVSRFYYDRRALAGIALTVDTSVLTAIGNDYGYERTFARQVEALGRAGDVLVALSTSGNSPNILAAVEAARAQGVFTIGMTGQAGGKLRGVVDLCLCVPSDSTPRIQELHITLGHALCAGVEARCCPRKPE